jgi:hypothetical protein
MGKRNQNSDDRAVNELEKVMNTGWVCPLTSLHVEAVDCSLCSHVSYTHCHSSKQLAACAESTIPMMTPPKTRSSFPSPVNVNPNHSPSYHSPTPDFTPISTPPSPDPRSPTDQTTYDEQLQKTTHRF